VVHSGVGELEELEHLEDDRYAAIFNIDGCSWAYDARFDEPSRRLRIERCLVGEGELSDGVLHGLPQHRLPAARHPGEERPVGRRCGVA
jgi:hypothetical protein